MELDYFVDVCVSRYVYRVLLSVLSDCINRQWGVGSLWIRRVYAAVSVWRAELRTLYIHQCEGKVSWMDPRVFCSVNAKIIQNVPMRTILWCWRSSLKVDINLWLNGLVWVICMCSFVVIIVIISAYIISLRIPCSTVEMETPRDAPSRGMLIRIKAVIYVDWELPDKFRGKEADGR